jgi:class 3 adenylate cyclase
MDLIKLAHEATRSPGALRKLWRSGPEGRPPDFPEATRQGIGIGPKNSIGEPYSILARAANEFGESFLALDIATHGEQVLAAAPSNDSVEVKRAMVELGHARSMAMLRTGRIEEARTLLEELCFRFGPDLEIAAALARSHKDFAFLSDDPDVKVFHLNKALDLYSTTYKTSDHVFPGINTAAISLWLGLREQAERIAREIETACLRCIASDPPDYWDIATLAESQLILGKEEEAARNFAKARQLIEISHKWANLAATRKQARRTCEHLQRDFAPWDEVFRFPQVIVFSGHMFDRPGRPQQRFPPSLEQYVRESLASRLTKLKPGFGVTSAASGADFLFIEEMLALKADVRVVLPWPKEDFVRSSVNLAPGTDWTERFNSLLDRVTSVTYLSQQTEPKKTALSYEYLNQTISGLALFGAQFLETSVVPLAVWDEKAGDGLGGTSSFVSFWRQRGDEPEIVRVPSLPLGNQRPICREPAKPATEGLSVARGQETIKTMLFADVSGYTKLPPQAIDLFVNEFLGRISKLMDDTPAPTRPILSNTWGDAIYLVFDEVISGGQFALRLRDLVEQTDWMPILGTKLSLRISLHTGPVLLCVDPIVRRMSITGSHVSHAARVEPVVNSGEIWSSEGFAAHSAIASYKSKHDPGYRLDYLGQKELSKKYGSYALFRLRAKEELPKAQVIPT